MSTYWKNIGTPVKDQFGMPQKRKYNPCIRCHACDQLYYYQLEFIDMVGCYEPLNGIWMLPAHSNHELGCTWSLILYNHTLHYMTVALQGRGWEDILQVKVTNTSFFKNFYRDVSNGRDPVICKDAVFYPKGAQSGSQQGWCDGYLVTFPSTARIIATRIFPDDDGM